MLSIERRITGSGAITLAYLREVLSQKEYQNPSRPLAYHKVIALLFRHRRFEMACELYERMTDEGILPSATLQAKLRGISIVCTAKSTRELKSSMKELFQSQAFDESSFRELMGLLAHTEFKIDGLYEMFLDSRGEDYAPSGYLISDLVGVQMRAGLMEATKDLLNSYVDQNNLAESPTAPYPYTTMMNVVKEYQYSDAKAMDHILERMQDDEVPPDTATFNVLIASQVWRHAYSRAFALYRMLCGLASGDNRIVPDAFTFGSLFKALQRINIPRSPLSRKYREPGNVVPPRQLYHDMVSAHLFHTNGKVSRRSEVITPSILNVALRTFLTARDYAAALVVVRSFSMTRFKPTLSTYVILVNHVIAKVRLELKAGVAGKAGSWCQMLGINLRDEVNARTIAASVLRLSASGRLVDTCAFGEERGPEPPSTRIYKIPSVSALNFEDSSVSAYTKFDTIPLTRILRQIVLTTIHRIPTSPRGQDLVPFTERGRPSNVSPATKISHAIQEAKKVMIPNTKAKIVESRAVCCAR
jgi:pentatricopeptide repeat protein